jgi:hypothetical protein
MRARGFSREGEGVVNHLGTLLPRYKTTFAIGEE